MDNQTVRVLDRHDLKWKDGVWNHNEVKLTNERSGLNKEIYMREWQILAVDGDFIPAGSFFRNNPDMFNTIVTVSALLNGDWTFSKRDYFSGEDTWIYVHDNNLSAEVRNSMVVNYQLDVFKGGTFFYSPEYDQIILYYGGDYSLSDSERMHNISKYLPAIRKLYGKEVNELESLKT